MKCAGFSLRWLLLLQSMGSRHVGFSSCDSWALEHRLSSCGAMGLVAPRHVGSSQTRARTCVPCISRQILNHCATRETLKYLFIYLFTFYENFRDVLTVLHVSLKVNEETGALFFFVCLFWSTREFRDSVLRSQKS